ncbi:MAG: AAA domain-containing protein [Fulvivirga sp.]
MHQLLKSYLKRLTNLTANNRSLLLLKVPAEQYIDIYDFNFVSEGGCSAIIENLIAGRTTKLAPVTDSRDEDANIISRKLKRLQRSDKFIRDERGSQDLYVGWPFVRGKFNDGTSVRAPLLFFPVELDQEGKHWKLFLRSSGVMFNKSFLLAYAHFNEIKISDDFLDRNFEDFDTDRTVFKTGLYQLLKDSPIELNFNQENFQDEINAFEIFNKKDFEDTHNQGQLKMFPEAVLGIFPQAGSYLVPDYLNLIENKSIKDLEEFFAERTLDQQSAHQIIRSVTEEKSFTPFKMDAHQEIALKGIKGGKSLVVQGPPGTGKSQLICNLIADHMAVGKKVLVVCQKRAALDVVYQRMDEKELTDFLGLVHDFRNDRKHIYQKIARQVDRIDEYKMKNNGLDAIQLERSFLQMSRRIDQITEELEEFKFALFDESECDISVKELYLTSDLEKPTINIKQEYTNFKFGDLPAFLLKLKNYIDYAQMFDKTDHPWGERVSFQNFVASDIVNINSAIDEVPAYLKGIGDQIEALVGQRLDFDDCDAIYSKRDYVVEMLSILKDKQAYEYFQHMVGHADSETSSLWLSNTERVLLECYKGVGPETSLPADQLGKFQEVLQRSMDARKSLVRLIQWSLFSKDKYFIKRVLVENGLKRNREGFKTMVNKVDNRLNLEHNLTKIKQKEWIKDVPDSYEKVHFQNWFYIMKMAVKAKLIFNSVRNLKEFFNVKKMTYEEFREKIEALYAILRDFSQKKTVWQLYLTSSQIVAITEDEDKGDILKKSVKKDFDALCEYDKLKANLNPQEHVVINKLIDNESVALDGMMALFQNSLRLAWIDHIETKYPILRSVSSMKFQQLEAELQNCVREKLRLSNDMLLLRAREKTYENVEYNRLSNMVTYRDLHHQVTKKKRIWPIRKVIDQFSHELFDLMPCWLASPESVSAIFPMREMFDLVIFDEASQCFVERGIPAIYRGRQVLVAGDDKQLRPNDLYMVRYEEETDDSDVALEVDSLLELANHHLKDVQLKGHYRSKSLELIDFSNKHFYDGNLKLLPDQRVVNSNEPAIEYVKLDGVWENNTNKVEANAVVDLLLRTLKIEENKSVGVVTFNARQQQLILDIIDERFISEGKIFPPNWFVKNIENVQGDEKDIIIFSTGYAPDQTGKMVMQFGSLNAVNGENRLNVAVTRAREKIVIITSIYPQQLKVEGLKNEGPKLLQQYLAYAKDVSEGTFVPTPQPKSEHHVDWYLKQKLQAWASEKISDYTFSEELPFADLTVKQDKKYLGLIVTDDDLYYHSPSIKDMHVYTPFALSGKNWKFKGVFSREFWNDPKRVEEGIQRFTALQDPESQTKS